MLEQTKQQMAALHLKGMLLALEEQESLQKHQLSFEERLVSLSSVNIYIVKISVKPIA